MTDDLSIHERLAIREWVEAAGSTLRFLPPYSPGFTRSRTYSRASMRC
ncbi:hypothetical protein [Tistrella mobilis]